MCLRSCRPAYSAAKWSLTILILAISCFAQGQILYQEQEIEVHDLPTVTAKSHDPSAVLQASLNTILHDKAICCGKDSALEDSLAAADPKSLKDIAGKLDGRHLLGDGRPIQIKTEYLTPDAVNAGHMVGMILEQRASLIMWNSHLYVVHGVVFIWDADNQGNTYPIIRKLLLWDTRYSDSHREVVFTRAADDMAKVEGLLFVQVAN